MTTEGLTSTESLSTQRTGRMGETLVMLELEKKNWMVFSPHFEEMIDLVAVKVIKKQILFRAIQVKTTSFETGKYSVQIKRAKHISHSAFFYCFCFMDGTRNRFFMIPAKEFERRFSRWEYLQKHESCLFHPVLKDGTNFLVSFGQFEGMKGF